MILCDMTPELGERRMKNKKRFSKHDARGFHGGK